MVICSGCQQKNQCTLRPEKVAHYADVRSRLPECAPFL
ncbi:Unknown protein sequence [Pseudomonas coronafaciens pv. oryzae]|nr:Unknown protein sequence [Pseudomonas coronafaciens pv. oryzae]